jgi:hypothetical protein
MEASMDTLKFGDELDFDLYNRQENSQLMDEILGIQETQGIEYFEERPQGTQYFEEYDPSNYFADPVCEEQTLDHAWKAWTADNSTPQAVGSPAWDSNCSDVDDDIMEEPDLLGLEQDLLEMDGAPTPAPKQHGPSPSETPASEPSETRQAPASEPSETRQAPASEPSETRPAPVPQPRRKPTPSVTTLLRQAVIYNNVQQLQLILNLRPLAIHYRTARTNKNLAHLAVSSKSHDAVRFLYAAAPNLFSLQDSGRRFPRDAAGRDMVG